MLFDFDHAQADDVSIVGGVGSNSTVLGFATFTIVVQYGLFIRTSVSQLILPNPNESNLQTFMGRLHQSPCLNKLYWILAIGSCITAILNMLYLTFIFFHGMGCNTNPQRQLVNDTLSNKAANATNTRSDVGCVDVMPISLDIMNRTMILS